MVEQPADALGEGSRASRVGQQTGRPRNDEVRHTVHRRRDDRPTGCHGLRQPATETLIPGGDDEHVERGRDPGSIVSESREHHVHAEPRGLPTGGMLERPRFVGRVTDHDERDLRMGPADESRHAHEVQRRLLVHHPADPPDDGRVGGDPELRTDRWVGNERDLTHLDR
jgi:hypothetical protein